MRLQVEYMRYIVEVEKTRNISLAAKRLHVSQPNISQGIKKVETELGIILFERSRAGSIPTKEGKRIISLMHNILDNIDELKHQSKNESKLLEGTLSISTIPSLSMSLLPKTVSIIKSQYPKLDINITEDNSINIIDKISKGEMDIGLIGVPSPEILPQQKINTKFFMESNIMACVGKNTDLANKESVTLKEIIQYPILSNSNFVIKALQKYGNPKFLFKSKNLEGAKQTISEGLAIGFYTDISLKYDPYVHMGKIVPLHIENENLSLSFYIIQRKNKRHLPNEKFIIEFLEQVQDFENIN